MPLKNFNPTSPGQRNLILVDRSSLFKGKPIKKLTEGLKKTGGRNNSGHITSWQREEGIKDFTEKSILKEKNLLLRLL